MRILLFTGKGGVGKTSVAAATAVRAAARGTDTLVLSTDPAHSLADALGVPVGAGPTPICDHLDAQQLDARARLEDNWREVQEYLRALLRWGGAEAVAAEELAVLPGLEELFALLDVRDHARDGTYDLLVVDCAPTAETLRLLSLPDVLGWYLQRLFPAHRRLAGLLRPVVAAVSTMPLPDDRILGTVEELAGSLAAVNTLLTDAATTSVRLVVNPESLVLAEARRTHTHLSLFGYHTDAVVMNRLLPDHVDHPFFAGWHTRQRAHLDTARESFGGAPVLCAELTADEPVGEPRLQALAGQLYGDTDPAGVRHTGQPLRVEQRDGLFVLSLPLPHVDSREVELSRRDDELSVAVGPHRRTLVLPAALARGQVTGAGVVAGRLEVRFTPRVAAPRPSAPP